MGQVLHGGIPNGPICFLSFIIINIVLFYLDSLLFLSIIGNIISCRQLFVKEIALRRLN